MFLFLAIKRMKRVSLAMAIALFIANISPPVWAQSTDGSILGFVFDGNNGEPVRGAKVSVNGHPDLVVATDLDGTYTFKLPAARIPFPSQPRSTCRRRSPT